MTRYSLPVGAPSLLVALHAFARRRPHIEPAIYGSFRAYRSEAARVTRDLARVERLLDRAIGAGVTDAHIREATRGDRLTIDDTGAVDYCIGQYFPTEYRRAVARILDRAIASV